MGSTKEVLGEMAGELDLNFAVDREEKAGYTYENLTTIDGIQVDLNQQEQEGSLSLPTDLRYEDSGSHYDKSFSMPTESDHDDVRITKINYDQGRTWSPSKDNHYQGEVDELRGNYFDKSSFQFEAQAFHRKSRTEDSAHSQEYPLTANANQVEKIEVNSHIDKLNIAPHDTESKDDNYSDPRNSSSDSEKMDMPLSDPHSPVSDPKRSTSPVTARQISVSPEKSPFMQQSPNGHKPLSSQQGVQDPSKSPLSRGQRYPSSPERSDLGRGVAAWDHSPHRSHHKDGSLKRRSPSPKTHQNHRRRNRSISRSPVHRRDSSSGYKRDHYDRSRSRSPYTRDRHRSPRRRYSPRRRSPPAYHSRRQSPRRKPWSPPPNRRTGLGKPGKNLFVAGFSFFTTERDLERKFSRFGRVRDIRIVRDKRNGNSRGFGFLSMEKDEDADAAIRTLDETEWNGRIILVEKSNSSEH